MFKNFVFEYQWNMFTSCDSNHNKWKELLGNVFSIKCIFIHLYKHKNEFGDTKDGIIGF